MGYHYPKFSHSLLHWVQEQGGNPSGPVTLSRLPSLYFLQPQHLCRLYGLLVFSLKISVGSLLVYLVFWFLLVEEVFSGYVWLTILPSFLKIISFLKKTVYFYVVFSLFIIVFIRRVKCFNSIFFKDL